MSFENLLLMSLRSSYLDNDKIYPPLALFYLKAAVNEQLPDVNVELMDDYNLDEPEVFAPFDIIGLSVMTPQRAEAARVLKVIKQNFPGTAVVIGGPHAQHYLDEVSEQPFDYVVPIDGQRSLVQILKKESDRLNIDVMNKEEWKEQPNPDRTSVESQQLLKGYNYMLNGRRATTMLTATGCPEQCTFCEEAETPVRWRNVEDLAREMNDIITLGYRAVYLFDDLFAVAIPKVKPIAEELAKRDLTYRCNGQTRYFTKEGDRFAKLLTDTGCYEIAFGFESGSQQILDNVNKRTTVEQNYQAIKYAKEQGLQVKGFMMLGLPGETLETVAETEAFIRDSGMDDFQLAIYYPYKGTKIRDEMESWQFHLEGLTFEKGDKEDIYMEREGLGAYGQKGGNTEAVVRTSALSSSELLALRNDLVEKYKPISHSEKWKDKFFENE